MLYSKRSCPSCNSNKKKKIYSQIFDSFSEGTLLSGYEVTLCEKCGMAFADNIPDQSEFDKYYSGMSKYETSDHKEKTEDRDLEIYSKIAECLIPHIDLLDSIADIGCATGVLLNEFKKRGFKKLTGFDPSEVCCNIGRVDFGLEMRHATINQLPYFKDRYDVVMATGVLEHICDVEASLASLRSILKPGGRIFLAVPDASRYDQHFGAPFQYFSMEHINFFGPESLSNLMRRQGFKVEAMQRLDRHLGPKSIEPIVIALFSVDASASNNAKIKHDAETEIGLNTYIRKSQDLEKEIKLKIDKLVETQAPLIVWAVGTHTLRLLKTSSLGRANIVAFVDSNKNYHGKTLHGLPIIAPNGIGKLNGDILISSQVAEDEIKVYLMNSLKWKGQIYTLYS